MKVPDLDQDLDTIEQVASFIEKFLGVPQGFISRLVDEDDWSFVIKAHALVEATLTSWISLQLNESRLTEALSFLEVGHPKYGKVALTKALDMTVKQERVFLRELTRIRNKLAHNVEHVSFSFDRYLSSINRDERRAFVSAFSYAYLRERENGKIVMPVSDVILNHPKRAIFHGIEVFLTTVALKVQAKRFQAQASEYQLEILDLLMRREKLRDTLRRDAADS